MMRFYGLSDADIMAMPVCRLFVYAKQIPALRAEDTMHAIEAAAFPQLEKRARKRALRRLEREMRDGEVEPRRAPGKKPQPPKLDPSRMIGDIPADLIPFMSLEKEKGSQIDFSNLVTIVRKPKEKPQEEEPELH